jgi:hypothetical protein
MQPIICHTLPFFDGDKTWLVAMQNTRKLKENDEDDEGIFFPNQPKKNVNACTHNTFPFVHKWENLFLCDFRRDNTWYEGHHKQIPPLHVGVNGLLEASMGMGMATQPSYSITFHIIPLMPHSRSHYPVVMVFNAYASLSGFMVFNEYTYHICSICLEQPIC